MKTIIIILALMVSACSSEEEKICDYRFINNCRTKAEWDQISQDNLKAIACMDAEENKLMKLKLTVEERLQRMYKACNVKEVGRVY